MCFKHQHGFVSLYEGIKLVPVPLIQYDCFALLFLSFFYKYHYFHSSLSLQISTSGWSHLAFISIMQSQDSLFRNLTWYSHHWRWKRASCGMTCLYVHSDTLWRNTTPDPSQRAFSLVAAQWQWNKCQTNSGYICTKFIFACNTNHEVVLLPWSYQTVLEKN